MARMKRTTSFAIVSWLIVVSEPFRMTPMTPGVMASPVLLTDPAVKKSTTKKKKQNEVEGIPPVSTWPHFPVFLKAGENTQIHGIPDGQPLPLGVPFEFETPLFKGKMMVRLKDAKTDDMGKSQAYFQGRKRLMQTVVQGRFKKPLALDQVYVGSIFRKRIKLVPPPSVLKVMKALIRRTAPGIILDLESDQPKVVSLYAGTAHSVSVDRPGEEPDITAKDLPENTLLLGNNDKEFKSAKHRKKHLSKPNKAERYHFDPDLVYTLHHHDDTMDYGKYKIKLPMCDYDLGKAIGLQPMSLSALTSSGESIFHFEVWHESIYQSLLKEE